MPLKTLIESFSLLLWNQLSSDVYIAYLDVFEEGFTVAYVNAPPGNPLSISHYFFRIIWYIQVVLLVQ